jgi:hypothetical protein
VSAKTEPEIMSERSHGDGIDLALFLDEPPDVPRRPKRDVISIEALFADEDAPASNGTSAAAPAVRDDVLLPEAGSADRYPIAAEPAAGRHRFVTIAALFLGALLVGALIVTLLLI